MMESESDRATAEVALLTMCAVAGASESRKTLQYVLPTVSGIKEYEAAVLALAGAPKPIMCFAVVKDDGIVLEFRGLSDEARTEHEVSSTRTVLFMEKEIARIAGKGASEGRSVVLEILAEHDRLRCSFDVLKEFLEQYDITNRSLSIGVPSKEDSLQGINAVIRVSGPPSVSAFRRK